MSVSLPNGSQLAIASGYASSKVMSAITNANPGVATLAASHGVVTGDILELTSGWSELTNKIVKAGTVSTNDVPLLGQDTTSTTIYPAGGGAGSVRVISGWTQLQQIMQITADGGEQQFATYQFLESKRERRIPSVKSAAGLSIMIADDATLAGYILAAAADTDGLPRAVRLTLPSGGIIYYNAYVTLDRTPRITINEIMGCQVTLSLLAEPVRV